MTDFFDLLKKRRSIRLFEDRSVSTDQILEIIQDSTLAPSSGNGQPWRFIVVNNREMIKRLSDESKANLLAYLDQNPEAPIRVYEAVLRNENFNVFYNAPCLVLIAGPKNVRSLYVDCALAASYFMLGAAARGLGTCWVDLGGNIKHPETLEEIGLPADYRIVAPIIIGYPQIIPDPPDRKDPIILKVLE